MQEPPPVTSLLDELQAFPLWLEMRLAAPEIDWHCKPAIGEWCLTEVMCHLRDVEHEVHQPRFQAILQSEGAFLPGAVADEWVDERAYHRQNGPRALASFLALRAETVALLPKPDSALWQRQGQHSFFGPTTMHELLNLVVQHDQAHRQQIANLLAQQQPGRQAADPANR
jgi:hypothetical protein